MRQLYLLILQTDDIYLIIYLELGNKTYIGFMAFIDRNVDI